MNGAQHGGEDGGAPVAHDFSSNASPLGPPAALWQALQQADRRYYPDPAYANLRERLGHAHGLSPDQVLPTAGGAEAIRRLTLAAMLEGITEVWVPMPGFGDYALAARALELTVRSYAHPTEIHPQGEALVWVCDPCNPTGTLLEMADWLWLAALPRTRLVVDQAYAPLCLQRSPRTPPSCAWRLICPNKALGLTGVRAAYLLAPSHEDALCRRATRLAPSWVLAAEGQSLLWHWADEATALWLAQAREQLATWSETQWALLQTLGWAQHDSATNFRLVHPPKARVPASLAIPGLVAALRGHGIRVRDAASFGLPGWLRLSTQPPASQAALQAALASLQEEHGGPPS